MNKKPNKTDVLEDVLSGLDEDSSPSLEELDKLIHRSFRLTQAPSPESDKRQSMLGRALRASSTGKRKTTIYLTSKLADELDNTKANIRELMPEDARSLVTKSSIVNLALRILLREYEKRGEESILVKQLNKMAQKQ
ncbi:MAG: hypothetical protein D6E12_16025 [Desulfovibrio sp.]|nr:MAG: hypothetical protein D6E12_16025 [Desulfovibrio sp.]